MRVVVRSQCDARRQARGCSNAAPGGQICGLLNCLRVAAASHLQPSAVSGIDMHSPWTFCIVPSLYNVVYGRCVCAIVDQIVIFVAYYSRVDSEVQFAWRSLRCRARHPPTVWIAVVVGNFIVFGRWRPCVFRTAVFFVGVSIQTAHWQNQGWFRSHCVCL